MSKKTAVVIGAGVFGISAANRLAKKGSVNVKLISISNYAYFLPASVRVAVQNDSKGVIHPLKGLLHGDVDLFVDDVVEFNETRVLLKEQGELEFDALVVATGGKWTDPIGGTHTFRDDYSAYFEEQHNKIKAAKNIVLVGGGFNNVELAGELLEYYEEQLSKGEKTLALVQNDELLLPNRGTYGPKLRKNVTDFLSNHKNIKVLLNKRASISDDGKTVTVGDEILKADLLVRSTGIVPCVPTNSIENLTNNAGFIMIRPTFQIIAYPHIFAVGDVTDFDFKGIMLHNKWLSATVDNVISVISNPNVSDSQLVKVDQPHGHLACMVSVGSKNGFGQLPLPFIGTVSFPSTFVVMIKSRNLLKGMSKSILGNS